MSEAPYLLEVHPIVTANNSDHIVVTVSCEVTGPERSIDRMIEVRMLTKSLFSHGIHDISLTTRTGCRILTIQ